MKKFSEKYLNDINTLKTAVIGFEFEFYCKKPYYKLLELLNLSLNKIGIKVWGFRKYHSSFKVDSKNFKIEPDFSGGNSMIELITGPMNYIDAKIVLLKILKFLQDECYTNEKSSIHINISFNDDSEKNINQTNKLKMILNCDEDYVYRLFPERKNNIYARSVNKLIPFKNYDFTSSAINIIKNSLELSDNERYYGINMTSIPDGRIEFRYLGGKDYEYKTSEILDLLDYFIILTWNSISENLTEKDEEKLDDFLNKNINIFKNYQKLDYFIGNFPTITLLSDLSNDYFILNSQYPNFYDKLYDIINNIYNLNDCVINYDSDEKRLEISDASFKIIFDISGLKIVRSSISDGLVLNSDFIDCNINNTHLENCKIENSTIFNTKLINCKVDSTTTLKNCYVYGGYMDGQMEDGVIRSGYIGENAVISEKTQIIGENDDNYFGINSTVVDDSTKNIKIIDKGNKKIF